MIKISNILTTIALGLVTYLVIMVLFDIRYHSVQGTSMFPVINHGDFVITYNEILKSKTYIKRDDIVGFAHNGTLYIKRVIGIPGDEVRISEGLVFVNGNLHDHPGVLIEKTEGKLSIVLEESEYFVLGDNRANSEDSRSFGIILREEILGKVIFRCTPIVGL